MDIEQRRGIEQPRSVASREEDRFEVPGRPFSRCFAGQDSRDPIAVFKALLAVSSVPVHMVRVRFVMLVNVHD